MTCKHFRLWGENFFNATTKKWAKQKEDDNKRSFCMYVLDPIYKVSCCFGCPNLRNKCLFRSGVWLKFLLTRLATRGLCLCLVRILRYEFPRCLSVLSKTAAQDLVLHQNLKKNSPAGALFIVLQNSGQCCQHNGN